MCQIPVSRLTTECICRFWDEMWEPPGKCNSRKWFAVSASLFVYLPASGYLLQQGSASTLRLPQQRWFLVSMMIVWWWWFFRVFCASLHRFQPVAELYFRAWLRSIFVVLRPTHLAICTCGLVPMMSTDKLPQYIRKSVPFSLDTVY